MSQLNVKIVAALIRTYGKRVPGGAFEVTIPREAILGISDAGMIEESPTDSGFTMRFHPNLTIPGEYVEVTPSEPPPQPVEAPLPLPEPASDPEPLPGEFVDFSAHP